MDAPWEKKDKQKEGPLLEGPGRLGVWLWLVSGTLLVIKSELDHKKEDSQP